LEPTIYSINQIQITPDKLAKKFFLSWNRQIDSFLPDVAEQPSEIQANVHDRVKLW
jgi:hypothetical protein